MALVVLMVRKDQMRVGRPHRLDDPPGSSPSSESLPGAVYRTDVDALVEAAQLLAGHADPWRALEQWLEAYVAYVEGKRVFLTELHAAFEKDPQLKVDVRERVEAAAQLVLGRAQQAGTARADVSAADLMQLVGGMCMAAGSSPDQNRRLLAVVLAGLCP
jgi:hypothetical protein